MAKKKRTKKTAKKKGASAAGASAKAKAAAGTLVGANVIVPKEPEANALYQKGYFGDMQKGGKLSLSLVEAAYLLQKGRLNVKEGRKKIGFDTLLKAGEVADPNIFTEYVVYEDLRDRGYLVKTGFKFGAHFRIYKRGDKPGEAHSAFMVHAVPEYYTLSMTELSRIIRLGHSVKKCMWIAVVDNEGDVTYYQTRRIKP